METPCPLRLFLLQLCHCRKTLLECGIIWTKKRKRHWAVPTLISFPACLPTMFKITLVDFLTCQVRQIRSMESQVKWDMYREERCQTEEERREEAWHSNFGWFSGGNFLKKQILDLWIEEWICWIFLLREESGFKGSSWITVNFNLWGDDYTGSVFKWCLYVSRMSGLVWDSLGNMSRSTDWLEDIGSHYCTAHSIWRQKCIIAQQLLAHTILQHVYVYNRVCIYIYIYYCAHIHFVNTNQRIRQHLLGSWTC